MNIFIVMKTLNYLWPILLCLGVGVSGAFLQGTAILEWYPGLQKPAITPPAIVFPVVWTILYVLMGLSLSLLIDRQPARWLVVVWGGQLFCNFLWTILFFTCRSPLAGLVDILLIDVLVFVYLFKSYVVSRAASWLFVPYALWLLLATYLNAYIFFYNS